MPKYLYECDGCKARAVEKRRVEDRDASMHCACSGMFKRVFSANFNLITQPAHLDDGNKFAYGHSESERLANLKAEESAYEASYAGYDTSVKRVTPQEAFARSPLIDEFAKVVP